MHIEMQVKENNLIEEQIQELRQRLEEANETIEAIRSGQIDALVVKDDAGPHVYTLKTADQTYRVFIEKMREGAVTLNKKGLILYSNSRFASMLNLSLGKIIGSYFKDYIDPSRQASFDSLFRRGWKNDCKGETFFITADGKSIPVLLSLTNLELDEGIALSIIVTDLTDQKNIEKELRDNYKALEEAKAYTEKLNDALEMHVRQRTMELLTSREHFKFLADTIPVIVWTANPRGEYDYLNRQWYEFTGLTFEESKGQGWQQIIHPDDLEETLKEWQTSVETGIPFKREDRKRSVNGSYRWHVAHAMPFKDKEGKVLQWFGVCTDIEDQKKDMQKKDEFISMASHELKTPVTSLKVFTEILLMDAESKNNNMELNMLKKMDLQINKLTRLIGDLLDVSRVKSGQLNYDLERTNFNELVTETVNVLQLTTSHKLVLQLGEPTIVFADKNRIGQVITNLVSNAVKYSPHASKVDIYTERLGNQIKLCVRDYGIGIPVSEQSKLFTRFFRVSENNYPGLGLGLYICKEIITRHSGKITFDTQEGKGSTFCFSIPVSE
jgi:two-component system phosphate regulon sensor histidine kinase PhoR